MTRSPLRLGVLFSGGGRTLENLHERILDGTLPARIGVAISSSSQANGVERARSRGIACKVVEPARLGDADVFSEEITRELDASEVDLVVLGGFLKLYRFPPRYENRIVNIHPALLPAFGGKGFYGDRVHEAVLRSGVKFSGCTVHFVTAEYDEGPIILQRIVPVRPGDTVPELAARVFREECIAYPEAIRLYAENRLEVAEGRVRLRIGDCASSKADSVPA